MNKIKQLLESWRHTQKYWDGKSKEDASAGYRYDARRMSGEYKDRADELEKAMKEDGII